MTPFRRIEARAHRLLGANIDTDQIMPARFMKEPRKPAGYGRFLLHDLIAADPALAPPAGTGVILAGRNFGCGSSREAAVYALADAGVRCVIAPSFGDIFASNAVKNGLLPAQVSNEVGEALAKSDAATIAVDLEAMTLDAGAGALPFTIDPTWRLQLLNGWDDIDLTLAEADKIADFTARDALARPWAALHRAR